MIRACLPSIVVLFLTCRSLSAFSVPGNDAHEPAIADPPETREVMSRVRSQLPQTPLLLSGRLLTAARIGRPEPICHVDVLLLLNQDPPRTRYTISDLFGEPLEQMIITRTPNQTSKILYEKGTPLAPAPVPDLMSAIRETGITWNDLTLSFLWWDHGTVAGKESRRGRECIVVEFEHEDNQGSTRLWIDENLFMIIQAEQYDSSGERVRRLSIQNIKRIGDMWMVKDMEIRSYPSMDRTLLRFNDVLRLNGNDRPGAAP